MAFDTRTIEIVPVIPDSKSTRIVPSACELRLTSGATHISPPAGTLKLRPVPEPVRIAGGETPPSNKTVFEVPALLVTRTKERLGSYCERLAPLEGFIAVPLGAAMGALAERVVTATAS